MMEQRYDETDHNSEIVREHNNCLFESFLVKTSLMVSFCSLENME